MFNSNYLFLKNNIHKIKNTSLLVPKNILYYTVLHFRLATNFYSSQLVDIFAYELPLSKKQISALKYQSTDDTIVVYNFHNLMSQERFFLFAIELYWKSLNNFLFSITEIYPNANWLEREVTELHGTSFGGKKDLRNLMLQYGDSSAPFQKSYPSIGFKEMVYDALTDLIIQVPTTVQS